MSRFLAGLAVGLGLAAQSALAEDATGDWAGVLKPPNAELHIGVHLTKAADGSYSGSLDSIDQGAKGVPLSDVKTTGDSLSFALPAVGGLYQGKWDEARKAWVGTWSQSGESFPLELARASPGGS
jgi:hypothetical protein